MAMATILIVDDEIDLREILTFGLEMQGYACRSASNGSEALAVVEAEAIDLVLSDVRMPGGDGIALVKAIRQSGRWQLPVILVSGFTEMPLEQVLANGAWAFLKKPTRAAQLEQLVGYCLKPRAERLVRTYRQTKSNITLKLSLGTLDEASLERIAFGSIGFFLKDIDHHISVGDEFEFVLEFKDSNQCLEGIGLCHWLRSDQDSVHAPGIGVEITELTEESLAALTAYLEHSQPGAAIPIGMA